MLNQCPARALHLQLFVVHNRDFPAQESWLEALRASGSDRFKAGAWNKIYSSDGKEYKFQRSQWLDKLQDDEFRSVVFDIMDEEIIRKFDSEGKNFALEDESEG